VVVSSTAHRIGFENLLTIRYENLGTVSATDVTLAVDFGNKVIPLESNVAWSREDGTEKHWSIREILPGETGIIYVTDSIATTAIIEEELVVGAKIYGSQDDCSPQDNLHEYISPAVGAFDPNDIAVTPEGHIKAGEELTYKIRFQNVGNAPVSTVRIEDELPKGLDLNSVVVGAVSHAYRFEIEEQKLIWTFENINMPDSLTNEPESHGYVYFKVKTRKDLDKGFQLPNKAAIFFDVMDPVITNEVVNFIGRPKSGDGSITFSPNPTTEESLVVVRDKDGLNNHKLSKVEVFDFTGRKILSVDLGGGEQYMIKSDGFESGCYFVVVTDMQGDFHSGKLLVGNR